MGLDITIREHVGFSPSGFLQMRPPQQELDYSTERLVIRHEISKKIEMQVLSSGKRYDWEEYLRPKDFKQAYEWSGTLPEKERVFIEKLLACLELNENYWLDFSS